MENYTAIVTVSGKTGLKEKTTTVKATSKEAAHAIVARKNQGKYFSITIL